MVPRCYQHDTKSDQIIAREGEVQDEITNKDDKFILSELLRETMLTYLHKEIPYNISIVTSHYKILKSSEIKIKQIALYICNG